MKDLDVDKLILDGVGQARIGVFQRLRIRGAVLFKGPLYEQMVGLVKQECYARELIDEDERVQSAIDWATLLQVFIEQILPLIIQLFGMRRGLR